MAVENSHGLHITIIAFGKVKVKSEYVLHRQSVPLNMFTRKFRYLLVLLYVDDTHQSGLE